MSELWKLPGYEISELVRSKQISAVEVTKAHLERLKEVNPKLNAVVQEMPEEAIEDAKEIDKKIQIGEDPGILCGVPLTIKVLADQKGFATTNGLKIQKDLIAKTDSPIVSNVKQAGALIVGRTNTPAFSLRWFTNNDIHGQTLNPHHKNLTPGGSSGGSSNSTLTNLNSTNACKKAWYTTMPTASSSNTVFNNYSFFWDWLVLGAVSQWQCHKCILSPIAWGWGMDLPSALRCSH